MRGYVVPYALMCPECGHYLRDETDSMFEVIRIFVCVNSSCPKTNRRFQLRLTAVELIEEGEKTG